MDLKRFVYTALKEEETTEGWNKTTVDYVIENEKRVRSIIRGSLRKRLGYINSSDVDEIYSDICIYFFRVDDYNISKATRIEVNGKEEILPIEGYIFKSIDFCVKRFIHNKYSRESSLVSSEVKRSDGDIVDLLNTVIDNKTDLELENIMVDLNQHCKHCESMRYKYGIDIFQVWFIGLLTINKKLDSSCYDTIMNILGINKKDLRNIGIKSHEDDTLLEFAMGISKHGVQESIEIIKPYIYSADIIEETINNLGEVEVA